MTNDETPDDHRIVFLPSGRAATVGGDATVLDTARQMGVDIDSVCGGIGICTRCQVEVPAGTFAKWNITTDTDALSGVTETEAQRAKRIAPGRRLACQARVLGDVVIDVPATSQVHRPVVRKDLGAINVAVDPRLSLFYVDTTIAAGDSPASSDADPGLSAPSAFDQIAAALTAQHRVAVTGVDPNVLPRLQSALAAHGGAVTVALPTGALPDPERGGSQTDDVNMVAIWPGLVDTTYGVAVDVGSTTIAAHLVDLAAGTSLATRGVMNPQIRFGDDLMSRVSYVMMNPGSEAELTDAVRTAIGELIVDLAAEADVALDRIMDVVLVGNPIMHHLLLGIDPTPLGQAPFPLATDRAVTTTASAFGWNLPNAAAYVGPCIAGHVGADTAAAILSDGPHRSDDWRLLVDVGTNAEIVLGNASNTFAASSPTGPAFEGAQITYGQRATSGAIERVRINPVTGQARFSVIGVEPWSDDPAFAAAIDPANGGPGITGICGSGIIEVIAEMYLAGLIDADGTIVDAERAPDGAPIITDDRTNSYVLSADPQIVVTQNDVRAIQLAKAALRAGIDLLVDHAGSPSIAHIGLAGAFGAHIDPTHAMVLGLIPDAPLDAVAAVGNAAGAGAVAALLSMRARAEMEAAAAAVIKIETATEPTFQQRFVDAMALPHATAPTDHLSRVVTLPTPSTQPTGSRRSGRSGRRTRARTEGTSS